MGEADVLLTQAEEKRPEPGLLPAEDPVVWSHEVEVCLFHAMIGHKPVGVNRHFHMICIRDKFSQNIGRQVSSSIIWDHLGSMYDMQALHESEILPFPNSEKSFCLPDDIIQEVKEEEDTKEEFRMERDTASAQEEVKVMKDRGGGGAEGKEEKRKRRTDKLLPFNPSSPGGGGAKRRRT